MGSSGGEGVSQFMSNPSVIWYVLIYVLQLYSLGMATQNSLLYIDEVHTIQNVNSSFIRDYSRKLDVRKYSNAWRDSINIWAFPACLRARTTIDFDPIRYLYQRIPPIRSSNILLAGSRFTLEIWSTNVRR